MGNQPSYQEIPLLDRTGEVTGRAKVDGVAAGFLRQWRWHLGHGYAVRSLYLGGGAAAQKTLTVHMHRLVFGVGPGGPHIDHIDGDTLDNRRTNLRLATRAENAQNLVSARGGSSHYRGVSWNKARRAWAANCRIDGKRHFLGYFADEEEAARVAAEFRRLHMPFSTT